MMLTPEQKAELSSVVEQLLTNTPDVKNISISLDVDNDLKIDIIDSDGECRSCCFVDSTGRVSFYAV